MSSQSSAGELQNNIRQSTDQHSPAFACESSRDKRTFPGPWSVDQIPQGYRVFDANRPVLAYVVTGDQGTNNHSGELTLEEARRIACIYASLPDLITEPPTRRIKRSWWKSARGSN
jgi:hypothetical protein